MRRILILLLLLTAANLYFANTPDKNTTFASDKDTVKVITPAPYMAQEDEVINTILSRYHYKKFDLNDSLSSAAS